MGGPGLWCKLRLARLLFSLLSLPVSLAQRVLDILALPDILGCGVEGAGGRKVGGREAERARQCQAGLLHHAARGEVILIGRGDHALGAQLGEALADERMRAFGGVALAPGRTPQPVAQRHLAGVAVVMGVEAEPAQEVAAALLDGRPDAVAVVPRVVAEEPRQNLTRDHLARC